MPTKEIDRKIAVIFATDVVNYSKHMEIDESETVKSLRFYEKILKGLFKKYNGNLFNSGGDSFMAEFVSAVDAVECAVEFQKKIKTSNASSSTKVTLEFRIGINTGDVIKEKGNLLGEGVNIAARLEALALAGGISVSKSVFDYVKGKTKHQFNDLGIQKVKQNEFHAFDIVLDPSQKRSLKPKQSKVLITILALFLPFLSKGDSTVMFEFFSLPIYETGFNEMISILIKITLCVSLAIVLTATTSNIEIIYGLQKLKISPLLISILSFAIRYIDVFIDEFKRVKVAMKSRGYDQKGLRGLKPIAYASGAMLIRGYERGERVYNSMISRGFNGSIELKKREFKKSYLLYYLSFISIATTIVERFLI